MLLCCNNSFMSQATRPHRHLIYTRNAITTVCMQHAHTLGHSRTCLAGLQGFFHNAPPHAHPQKRGRSRQDHDICLCLNEIQNSAEMQAGRRFLLSEEHTPKPLANTFSVPNWWSRLGCAHECLHILASCHAHKSTKRVLLQICTFLKFSHTQAMHTDSGSGPHSHRPQAALQIGKWFLQD